MSPEEIKEKFNEVVARKDFIKRSGLSKHIVYHYRHKKQPSLGTVMEVLYNLDEIEINLTQ